ncbi:MAG TPA: AAA family ATPase [Firmicutes bacterium]|nr:AAA family ATPase [Bacillota bacterium]
MVFLAVLTNRRLARTERHIEVERGEPAPGELRLKALQQELDRLIGLRTVKATIREIQAFAHIQRKRSALQLASQPIVLHTIFIGNPGTGKTTVARLLSQMLAEMGVLEKGHTVEVERADLVAEYIGQTAHRTREAIKKAMGGLLFVDEAYALARGGERDFGKEAIDTLVKAMEDYRGKFVVVLAGYPEPMRAFLRTNPGLHSRFPLMIEFPDYSDIELFKIAESMFTQRQYTLTKGARRQLADLIRRMRSRDPISFGNARTIRNIVEKTIRMQAVRLMGRREVSVEELITVLEEDIQGDPISYTSYW